MKKKTTSKYLNLCYVICLMLAMTCLCSCSKKSSPADTYNPVSCHTEAQATYLADNYRNFKLYANGTEELSAPAPVLIGKNGVVAQYAPIPAPEEPDGDSEDEDDEDEMPAREPVVIHDFGSAFVFDDEIKNAAIPGLSEIRVSLHPDFTDSTVVYASDGCAKVYNLLLGTTYYCQINAPKKKGGTFTFTTDDRAPRNLYVDGVTNVRDLGGWPTADGKKVRQGLIIRSSKFNADESDELVITAEGIETMTRELKVRTEIDLRTVDDNENGGITKSPLGDTVNYISIPFQSGGNIMLLNRESMPELFSILGNEDNYPIVFHCSIGTDRTGAVAFLINGLLGVSKEDLYRDYLFSNFGNIGKLRTPSIINTYYDTVDMTAGSTLSEKIYNWLVGSGVAEEDLMNIKEILKEE